jgi:hypothetical protein
MKDLFMCLLLSLKNHGNIVAANMFRKSDYSNIDLETDDAFYKITIIKEDKKNEE